jgi:hypothetical protein
VGCEKIADPPDNVSFVGLKSRAEYEPLMREATVALGTLGLYRKQMHEACPLKVREYLALGLPVIAAYRDTDIPVDADYFLSLPNDNSPLSLQRERIVAFIDRWRTRRVSRAAIAHLDVAVKEKERLAFMVRIASTRQPNTS